MYNISIPRLKGMDNGSLAVRSKRRSSEGKEPCYTAAEVAKKLGIAVPTLNTWISEERFPAGDFYASSTTKRYWRMTKKLTALIKQLAKK